MSGRHNGDVACWQTREPREKNHRVNIVIPVALLLSIASDLRSFVLLLTKIVQELPGVQNTSGIGLCHLAPRIG